MEKLCEYYIPNNPDFSLAGSCLLANAKYCRDKKCSFAGEFPEVGAEPTATNQKDCIDYKEWQDPAT